MLYVMSSTIKLLGVSGVKAYLFTSTSSTYLSKLSNSGLSLSLEFKNIALRILVDNRKTIFKFVVVDEGYIEEILWYLESISIS